MAKKSVSRKGKAVSQAPVAAPKKKGISQAAIGAALLVLALITAAEIQVVMKTKIRESKTPEIVARWKLGPDSTGLTSMYNYGTNVYVVDGTRGTMRQYETMTGKFVKKFEITQGLYSMVQLSNGDVLALTTGTGVVRFPSGSVKPDPVKPLSGCTTVSYITADSKDNICVVDSTRNVIVKYDKKLAKIGEYGQGKLAAPRKIFTGPKDSMYVLDYGEPKKVMVKIFSETGELKKQFYVLGNSPASNYESLAVTPEGRLYINNMAGNSIMCYTEEGKLLGKFNTTKDNSVSIMYPPGICGGLNGTFVIPTAEILVLTNIQY